MNQYAVSVMRVRHVAWRFSCHVYMFLIIHMKLESGDIRRSVCARTGGAWGGRSDETADLAFSGEVVQCLSVYDFSDERETNSQV